MQDVLIPKQLIPELAPGKSIELAFILPQQASLYYAFKTLFNPWFTATAWSKQSVADFCLESNRAGYQLDTTLADGFAANSDANCFAFYLRRYRHPLLLQLSDNPALLLQLPPEQLSEALLASQKDPTSG